MAFPLLDAMIPALGAATARDSAQPARVFYVPNGMILPNFHPKAVGSNFEFTPVLKPLEPFRENSGAQRVEQSGRAEPQRRGGVHTRGHAAG